MVNVYYHKLFGHGLKGQGAADIPTANKEYFPNESKVYANTPEFLAKPGDIVVFGRNYGAGYGHVAVVLSATLNEIEVVEQNYLGGGWTSGNAQGGTGWEKATIRKHAYDFPMWFVRPNWKSEEKKSNPVPEKKVVAKKEERKPQKLTISKAEITGYNMDKRGWKPKGLV